VPAGRGSVLGPRFRGCSGPGRSVLIADCPSRRILPDSPLAFGRVKWICGSCGFIYDPAEGDPDGGIPAGTAFEDIPETWFCPVCGARKRDFEPYDD